VVFCIDLLQRLLYLLLSVVSSVPLMFHVHGVSFCHVSFFLSTVCLGATGDTSSAHEILKEVPRLMKRKNNQLERFVTKRVSLVCVCLCVVLDVTVWH